MQDGAFEEPELNDALESLKHEMVYFAMGKTSRRKKKVGSVSGLDRAEPGNGRIGLSSKAAPLVLIIIIVLFSFGVYYNALFNGFVYDDDFQVLKNPWIKDVHHLPEIFSKSVWSFKAEHVISNYYRPLMHMSYMLSYYLFGLKPWGFHLVNMLFHAGVSVLVFLITSRLLGESKPSTSSQYLSPPFIAGMLFASHPIHTEAVTWIAGLPDVAFTFFYLLSFYLYMLFQDGAKRGYLLSILSFAVATLLKEPALTLPIMLIAYDYQVKKLDETISAGIKRFIPYVVVSVVYLLVRYYALKSFAPSESYAELSNYQFIINVFPLFGQYLASLLWPFNLNLWHTFHPISSLFEAKGMVSIGVTVIFCIVAAAAYRKNKVLFFGLLLIVIPLLPVFYIKGISSGKPYAERYLYLPSVGFVLLLAIFLSWTKEKLPRSVMSITIAFLLIAGLYAVGTVNRNNVWKDDFSLFADTVRKSPDDFTVRTNLGNACRDKGLIDAAMEQYQAAVQLYPDNAKARSNLGVSCRDKGMIDKAMEQYEIALKLRPDYAEAHYNLGNAYRAKGLTDEAIQQYRTALQLQPDYAEAHYNLGNAFFEKGLTDEAMAQYQAVVTLRPDYVTAHNNLGNVYIKKGLINEAIGQYQSVLRLKPHYAEAHYNLGNAYLKKGLKDKAIGEFKQALNIRANFAEARQALDSVTK